MTPQALDQQIAELERQIAKVDREERIRLSSRLRRVILTAEDRRIKPTYDPGEELFDNVPV
jgi:hypothetical protein